MGGFTSRIARGLVSLMEARDADGYVFRTDLRLRPDPAVTPPAVALPAAITYYESMGQNWERAAMIKARPVAGDLALGAAFLEAIRPFVWRRGLDFAAVADIHAMKRRIDQHKGGALADAADPLARIAGHNVKLGEGGIREIEFLAQTLQLVWGGRDPGAARSDHAGRAAAAGARRARAARCRARTGRRLSLPAPRRAPAADDRRPPGARTAAAAGGAGPVRHLHGLRRRRRIRRRAAAPSAPGARALRRGVRAGAGAAGARPSRAWSWISAASMPRRRPPSPRCARSASATPSASSPRCAAGRPGMCGRCARRGRANCWRSCCRACWPRSPASRSPTRCSTGSTRSWRASRPACSCCRCSSAIPALLDRIAAVLGAAPSLADHLASHPAALDGLLSPDENPDPARLLRGRLRDARLLEDVIEITRRTVREEDFSISVATMEGRIDADEAGLRRTAIADAALGALLSPVLADFAVALRPGARRVDGGGGDGQGGRARDDGRLRPRPDADLRPSRGGERKPRRAAHAGEPVVRPRRARLCRGGDRARRGRPAVRGGHAAAAVGQQGPGRGVARRRSAATTPRRPGPGSAWR